MIRWAYTTQVTNGAGTQDHANAMDALGRDGWELVSAVPMCDYGGATARVILFFKRPMPAS